MKIRLMRCGALALATVFGASLALAQTPKAPPAGAAAAAPQPIKLDLIPLQAPWTKVCQKDPTGAKEFCRTIRAFGQSADQPPTLAMAIDAMSGDEKKIVRMQLPEGLLLRPGFRLVMEKSEPVDGRFSICAAGSCFAEADINNAQFGVLKKAQIASIVVRNQVGAEVTFNIPMHDFAAAIDGPAVDPKKIEEQNKALQDQLEKKAKEQREQIEKQQPAPAPAAPDAKAKPAPDAKAKPAK
ncbi:MAG: invasion associated locus B family protein [Pseudomonadota bacterium]|nr:invasion associated locus B family protein [Pseudomonadota bacterium]